MSRRRRVVARRTSRVKPPPVKPPRRRQASAEGFLAAIFAGLIAYVGVEMALPSQPHPTHWLVTVVFAFLAFGGAEAIYCRRNPF